MRRVSPHQHLPLAPIVVEGDIGVDGINVVLASHREQDASCANQCPLGIVEQLVLQTRLDPDERKARRRDIERMPVQPPGEPRAA